MTNPIVIPNITLPLKEAMKALELFKESMDQVILALEEKTSLPLREMFEPMEVKNTVSGNTELPIQYNCTFTSQKNPVQKFRLNFFVNGTIKVKLYWSDGANREKKYPNLSVESLLEYAEKIKKHLNPEVD